MKVVGIGMRNCSCPREQTGEIMMWGRDGGIAQKDWRQWKEPGKVSSEAIVALTVSQR